MFCPTRLLFALLLGVLLNSSHPFAAEAMVTITAARVWPAADYTRITFESTAAVKQKAFLLENPERLVVDLENTDLVPALTALGTKLGDNDPYVKSVRVGRFQPGSVRLVFDLKSRIKPQVFTLAPVGQYGHRLVVDLYPVVPADPLIAFLDERQARREQPAQSERGAPRDSGGTAQAAEKGRGRTPGACA